MSLALIVFIFVGVIPQFASYQGAWTAIQKMSPGWWAAILVAAVLNQVSFVWPYQAVLPHLRFWHGFMETQTSTAISNTVPAGGAVAIGMTFAMFGSFGFSNVAISTGPHRPDGERRRCGARRLPELSLAPPLAARGPRYWS